MNHPREVLRNPFLGHGPAAVSPGHEVGNPLCPGVVIALGPFHKKEPGYLPWQIALCVLRHTTLTPWVVWDLIEGEDGKIMASHGDYHREFMAAVESFQTLAAREAK